MKTILVDAVQCFVSGSGEINQGMHEMLETFGNLKIIVTNAPDEKISTYGLDKVPYPVFSLKKDPIKTDPRYFEILLTKKGLRAEDVVYFEHGLGAVESARAVGISTYHYDHEKKDLGALKEFLDANV